MVLDILPVIFYILAGLFLLGLVALVAGVGLLPWVAYLYYLRVPLLVAAGILTFVCLGFWTDARLLLNGAFDIDSGIGIGAVSFAAFLAASAVEMSWRLIYLYGRERFFVEATPGDKAPEGSVPGFSGPGSGPPLAIVYVLCNLIPVAIIFGTIYVSTGISLPGQCDDPDLSYQCRVLDWRGAICWAFGGFVLYVVLMIVLTRIQLRFTRRLVAREHFGVLFLPAISRHLEFLFGRAREKESLTVSPEGPPSWFSKGRSLGRGYVVYRDVSGHALAVAPGHVAGLILLGLTSIFYGAIGVIDYLNVRQGGALLIPTLCYVLLLFMLLCWSLSSLTFFFDRYRIPVLVPLIIVLFATSYWWQTDGDYLFQTIDPAKPKESVASSPNSIIVVAANGGGIQSAAWTARVLTGLEKECRTRCEHRFAGSVRLISSVSGGSVGTMYFVNEYTKDGSIPEEELNPIVRRAEGSSLDHIAWGLLYPDLLRTILPLDPEWDRGRALQKAWLREDTRWGRSEGVERGLSEWENDAALGRRPTVIFNTTVAETGKPLELATSDLPDEALAGEAVTQDEFLGEDTDVSVVTAARLSASYPYVSPAARAEPHPEGSKDKQTTYHVVDGGYYDNFGISSLVGWLDAELREEQSIERVLVVQIRGAPPGVEEPKKKRGWFYQALAPAYTSLHVRGAGQSAHGETELRLLIDKWDDNDQCSSYSEGKCVGDERHVDIETATFEFDRPDPPLSWHLTNDQKQHIEAEWLEELCEEDRREGWSKVQVFLGERGSDRACPPHS